MSRYYVNCYEDDKESRVKMRMEYRRVKRDLWRTGKSKDYVNGVRGIGCNKSQCSLCSAHPANKSFKKTKAIKNKTNLIFDDY